MSVLEVSEVTKRFGPIYALQRVSFRLESGELVALFGPNGSGKSTLLRLIAGVSRPTRGTIRVFGEDPFVEASARRRLGFLTHSTFFYRNITGWENLQMYARMYGLDGRRIEELAEYLGIRERLRSRVREYSRGMRQRLALVRALLHDPDLILLDEPFSGLDPEGAQALAELLREKAGVGKTVLMATHAPELSVPIATRALVLSAGKLVLDERNPAGEEIAAALRRKEA